MATVAEECTTEEQKSVTRFLWAKCLNASDFYNEIFPLYVGSVCRMKRFRLPGKRFSDDEEVETEVPKWLRQQSKDFYAAGFDAPVKRSDRCINVGEDISRNICFSQLQISHISSFISICDLFTDSPSYLLLYQHSIFRYVILISEY
jgi:hypothetical protein